MLFRPVGREDAELIAGVVRKSFAAQAEILNIKEGEYPNFVAFETAGRVLKRMDRGDRIIAAYLRHELIGTVSYSVDSRQPGRGYIRRLCVLPGYRGKEYGALLMAYAEGMLADGAVQIVELSIVARFHRLQRYYELLGYTPGERKTFPSLPFEVLFMEKVLIYPR